MGWSGILKVAFVGFLRNSGTLECRGTVRSGIARVPFVVGIDRYLPQALEKYIRNGRRHTFHPVQAGCRE